MPIPEFTLIPHSQDEVRRALLEALAKFGITDGFEIKLQLHGQTLEPEKMGEFGPQLISGFSYTYPRGIHA